MSLPSDNKHQVVGGSYYLPSFLSQLETRSLFNQLNSMVYIPRELMLFTIFEKTYQLPRDKQVFGDHTMNDQGQIMTPIYRYGGDYQPPVLPWRPDLLSLRDKIHQATGQYCNHCVVNRYLDGADHIGYHHDKTGDMTFASAVITITLGAARDMCLQNSQGKQCFKLALAPGSLFFLDWQTNKDYKHSIPKRSKVSGIRISLTFRSIESMIQI